MGELAIIERPHAQTERVEQYQVIDPIPVLDTARFEQMQRIAMAMASSSMCPDALTKDGDRPLDLKTVVANCFLVVNQAVRWGMDPFAVAQCVSVVHGKLCYEGKLIAAVLDAKLGVKLVPKYNDGNGDDFGVEIFGIDENGSVLQNPATQQPLTIKGTVGQWRTTGRGTPWAEAKNHERQLMYRGSREWTRFYRPAILLGVYAPDEMDDLSSASRSSAARDVSSARRPPPPPVGQEAPAPAALEHAPGMTMPEPNAGDMGDPAIEPQHEPERQPARRRAPAPPPPPADTACPAPADKPAEKPKPADDADFDSIKKRFANAAGLAHDREKLAEAWDLYVAPFFDDMIPPDQEDLTRIHRFRQAEIDG